jgi:hypothetical protein
MKKIFLTFCVVGSIVGAKNALAYTSNVWFYYGSNQSNSKTVGDVQWQTSASSSLLNVEPVNSLVYGNGLQVTATSQATLNPITDLIGWGAIPNAQQSLLSSQLMYFATLGTLTVDIPTSVTCPNMAIGQFYINWYSGYPWLIAQNGKFVQSNDNSQITLACLANGQPVSVQLQPINVLDDEFIFSMPTPVNTYAMNLQGVTFESYVAESYGINPSTNSITTQNSNGQLTVNVWGSQPVVSQAKGNAWSLLVSQEQVLGKTSVADFANVQLSWTVVGPLTFTDSTNETYTCSNVTTALIDNSPYPDQWVIFSNNKGNGSGQYYSVAGQYNLAKPTKNYASLNCSNGEESENFEVYSPQYANGSTFSVIQN